MKSLLPPSIISILNNLDDADRGQVYSAIFALIHNRIMIAQEAMTAAAYCVFQFYLREMGRKIERYHADIDRRNLLKAEKAAQAAQAAGQSQQKDDDYVSPCINFINPPDYIKADRNPYKFVTPMKQYWAYLRQRFPGKSKKWRETITLRFLRSIYPDIYVDFSAYALE